MRILNVSFKVISDSILESFVLDFKNLAALGAKVTLALVENRPPVAFAHPRMLEDENSNF